MFRRQADEAGANKETDDASDGVVKATEDSEQGILPTTEAVEEMGRFNEELVKAGSSPTASSLPRRESALRSTVPVVRSLKGFSLRPASWSPGFWLWELRAHCPAAQPGENNYA